LSMWGNGCLQVSCVASIEVGSAGEHRCRSVDHRRRRITRRAPTWTGAAPSLRPPSARAAGEYAASSPDLSTDDQVAAVALHRGTATKRSSLIEAQPGHRAPVSRLHGPILLRRPRLVPAPVIKEEPMHTSRFVTSLFTFLSN
jgi:hypothetical protein